MGGDFFGRLAGLDNKREVWALFDQIIARPLQLSSPELPARLYHALIERLLGWLELPAGRGAHTREWQPLYQLAAEVDPFYFTDGQLTRRLERCPPMGAEQRQELSQTLAGFLHLRREGFPSEFPSPLITLEECSRWVAIFPPQLAWRSLEVLHAAGLYPVGSPAGRRAQERFEQGGGGGGGAGGSPAELGAWQRLCHHQAGRLGINQGGAGAHRLDFLAAVFAGEYETMGQPGYCADVPRCQECPLEADCGWAKTPSKASGETEEIFSRILQGRAAHLATPQLLQALLDIDKQSREKLHEKLTEIPLRKLAGKNAQELREWLAGAEIEPARLMALFELCKRYNEELLTPGLPMVTATEIFRHYRMRLRDYKQEQFLVLLLDVKRRYLGEVLVSQGTLNESPVHAREVFNPAIRENAASIMIVHNHPSGDLQPSPDDIQVTRDLIKAGELLEIPVLDHIIIAGDNYLSFSEQGIM